MQNTEISWKFCQKESDTILNSGFKLLQKQESNPVIQSLGKFCGNYLITDFSGIWNYIGEAKDISKRIKQHSKESTSTFYKNYTKLKNQFPNFPQNLKINDFYVKNIQNNIGRKEIEEFGIVNLPAYLNKFQKSKRQKYSNNPDIELWHIVQNNFAKILEQGEIELMNSKLYGWVEAIVPPDAGLYWVESKQMGLIYIGESSNIYERYNTHSGTTYFSALRRHIGENILGFYLKIRNKKKRYFSEQEDFEVTEFLRDCAIRYLSISFGRYELEEYLIHKHKPFLNRKDNK